MVNGKHTNISVSPDQYLHALACPSLQASLSVVFDFIIVVSLGRSLGATGPALLALYHASTIPLCHHLSTAAWTQSTTGHASGFLLENGINLLLVLGLAHVVVYELKLGAFLTEDLETIDCGDILHRALFRVQLRIGL